MDKSRAINIMREEQAGSEGNFSDVFVIGQKLFIRTLTLYHTGKLEGIYRCGPVVFLKLVDAAWVASSGRFTQAIDDGTLDETEPVLSTPIYVNVASIVDFMEWHHDLPRVQK